MITTNVLILFPSLCQQKAAPAPVNSSVKVHLALSVRVEMSSTKHRATDLTSFRRLKEIVTKKRL